MCGIIGYVGGDEVVPVVLDGLRRLEYRGYDSTGLEPAHAVDQDRDDVARGRRADDAAHVSTRPAARRVLTAPPRGAASAASVGVVSS